MRAVNLLPSDLRRAGSSGGSGSGAGAYALLAALAVAVALVGFWAVTARQVKDREAEVTRLNAEAAAAESQAANLAGYEARVKVANDRREAVVGLIEKRFDWSKAFEDVSRTIPSNAWITTMSGTVLPGVSVEGGTGNQARAAHQGPAIELTGCTTSQSEVARLMSRLRAMKDVSNVSLQTSEKTDSGGAGGSSDSAAGSGQTDCAASSDQRPKFNLAIFYGPGTAQDAGTAAASGTDSAAAAPATTTPAPASGGAQ